MNAAQLRETATRYTAAWCAHNTAGVAACFAENGSLAINDGVPSIGRSAIAVAAQSFITTFPDMVVRMDDAIPAGDHAVYRWTLLGTNTGPGGTGQTVRISGYEEWKLGADGLIAESRGYFDEAEYCRQLTFGAPLSSHATGPRSDFLETFTKTGHQTLNAFLIVSGGVAASFLTFLSATFTDPKVLERVGSPAAQSLVDAMKWFVTSIVLCLVAHGITFLSHAAFYKRWERVGTVLMFATACVMAAVVWVLVLGCLRAFGGFALGLERLSQLRMSP